MVGGGGWTVLIARVVHRWESNRFMLVLNIVRASG
jgi:hypothetical protein